MPNLSSVVRQLKQERDRVEKQLSGLNAAIAAFVGVYRGSKSARKGGKTAKPKASRATRKAKPSPTSKSSVVKPKRTMSAAARRKIASAQKARWAARKAEENKSA